MKRLKMVKYIYSVFAGLLIAFGLTVMLCSGIPENLFMLAGGIAMIGFGVVRLAGYFSKDILQLAFQFDLILGIASAVMGCYMIWDSYAANQIMTILGLFFLIDALSKIQTAIDARRIGVERWWLILCVALVAAIIGVLAILMEFRDSGMISRLIGANLAIDGVLNLYVTQSTQRQAALDGAFLARQGKTRAEIREYLERNGGNSDIFIAVNTLDLLKKSGRVTAAGAALGSMLSIKPVLRIQSGKLDAYRKVRGMRSAMQAMIEGLREDSQHLEGERLFIRAAYAGDRQAGESWQATLQAAFPEYEVGLDPLPISVCCHVGYGALGVGIARDILTEAEKK